MAWDKIECTLLAEVPGRPPITDASVQLRIHGDNLDTGTNAPQNTSNW